MDNRTRTFQGMRLLLIIGICCLHIGHPILGTGAEICSFFFVLSGFLYNTKNDSKPWAYLKRKVCTIFPQYWICLALILTSLQLCRDPEWDWDIIPHILLLQSFVPSCVIPMKYLGVAWFLSCLMFCYAMSPFLSRHLRGINNPMLWCILIYIVVYNVLNLTKGLSLESWYTYLNPLFRLSEYTMGMLLAINLKDKPRQQEPHPSLSVTLFLAYFYVMHHLTFKNAVSIMHIAFIWYLYMYRSRVLELLLANKPVIYLARYCMFIFLTHLNVNIIVSYYTGYYPWYIIPIDIVLGTSVGIIYEKTRNYITTER